MPWLEWMSLFVRWFHVIAGVAWIGASFYFIWLDNSLRKPPQWKQDKGIKGDLWAVHGGGFYEVAKYTYGPEKMPNTLHWFKWEAYSTWLSGMALLVLIYYFGASAYLIDSRVMALTPTQAIGYGLAFIFGGLIIYEIACRSPLGQYPKAFAFFLVIFVIVSCWLATSLFSGRGAYIHIGALIGTIMVGNVFLNIMPAQRKMVNAVSQQQDVDPSWGAGAKLRSVHNNYFTLPLLFIMISNHYPMTYQHELNWLVLVIIIALSAWIRHFFNLKHLGVVRPSIIVSGALGMALLALWISLPSNTNNNQSNSASSEITASLRLSPDNQAVFDIVQTHCTACHSAQPSDSVFQVAPLGIMLDSWEQIEAHAPKIINRTVITKDMPLMNKSNMTDKERMVLQRWFDARQED